MVTEEERVGGKMIHDQIITSKNEIVIGNPFRDLFRLAKLLCEQIRINQGDMIELLDYEEKSSK